MDRAPATVDTVLPPRLGLRVNAGQFGLLVLVNAFVGGMVGLERTILPLIAEAEFGLASTAAILSFLVSFGLVKATANLFAGRLSDRWGRRHLLIAGWLAGLPVPLLLILAPNWTWVVCANVLLGINQGFCWSTTVIMKIDLVGPAQRGLAMGLNEAAGYLAVAGMAFLTGYLAAAYGLRPVPFYAGIACAVLGLLLSLVFVRETHGHARHEAAASTVHAGSEGALPFVQVMWRTSWKDRALFAVSQAGLVNNLNDGVMWGLLPLFLTASGLPLQQVGLIAAVYPGVWGLGQLATGALSDRWGRKWMIVAGMWSQAAGIGLFVVIQSLWVWIGGAALLGLGTALVYPTLLASISDVAHPAWRASAIGVYRLWRDGGYAAGGLMAGVLADTFGMPAAIAAIAILTGLSGLIVAGVMYETLPARRGEKPPRWEGNP